MTFVHGILVLGIASILLGAAVSTASAKDADDQWSWSITPYLWLPTLNAKFNFRLPVDSGGGTSVNSEIGPSDYLTDLKFALMLSAQWQGGERWGVAGDLVYLDLTADVSTVRTVTGGGGSITIPRESDLDTETDLSGAVVSLVGNYALTTSDRSQVSALAGVRYLTLDADIDWALTTTITGPGFTFDATGRASGDVDGFDAVVGLRGKFWPGGGEHWYLPWYLDVGTGDSDLTWQTLVGGGYAFSSFDVLFAWRQLDYDRDDNDVLQELQLGGFGLGFTWRF